MDKLFELLFRNPIILFLVGAWLVGMISNVAKARRKAAERRRTEGAPRPKQDTTVMAPIPQQRQASVAGKGDVSASNLPLPSVPRREPPPVTASPPAAPPQSQSPEQIAREMRRILGLEPEPEPTVRKAPPRPPVQPPPPPPRREERARGLPSHVDPHVGEGIRDRHMQRSKVGQPSKGRSAIGNLGGRVKKRKLAVARNSRYSLDDLRKAIVINEILSPPVSVRGHEDRRPG
ncbi:MAG: hypothetical protein KAI24_02390 [Planctomycetes bacterium]|nr:hypothetical protein [Planctomycetota bacterium]